MWQGGMRVSRFFALVASIGGALAVNTTGTPCNSEFLTFNSTNVATLAACTKLNYLCAGGTGNNTYPRVLMEYNSTTGPAPSTCRPFHYNLEVDRNITGSLSIPDVVSVAQAVFQGKWPSLYWNETEIPLNLTVLELPDLVDVYGVFGIDWADKLESLSVPKLTNIGLGLSIDISGENPPAINLSFPSLYYAGGIYLTGNIDAVDLPALNFTTQINITSTGNLDCVALAARVVNFTGPGLSNDTVICNSKKGSVTTYKPLPKGSASGRLVMSVDLMVLVGLVGCFSFIL